ncbi:hypothetical protein [Nostoc sp.]
MPQCIQENFPGYAAIALTLLHRFHRAQIVPNIRCATTCDCLTPLHPFPQTYLSEKVYLIILRSPSPSCIHFRLQEALGLFPDACDRPHPLNPFP